MYVWGYNGYCRLGLGNQVDALIPKEVPQFSGPNKLTMAMHVSAGPSNSVVIDNQNMYWIAGKWKNTGDGTCAVGFEPVPAVDLDVFLIRIRWAALLHLQVAPGHAVSGTA